MKERFIGTWKLLSYTVSFEGEEELFMPYGKDPKGYLIYTSTHVSVHVMRQGRLFKEVPLEEKIESAENYGGYVGRYEVSGDTVVHYPEICGFLSFLQTSQVRDFRFEGNLHTLECPYFAQDKGYGRSKLVWEKSS
jgi:hypothetical protein